MMWIKPETLEVSDELMDGYEAVLPTQPPLTGRLEKAVPGAPERRSDGMWYETWAIEPLTEAETVQVEEAERANATHSAAALRNRWKEDRSRLVAAIKVTTAAGNTFDGDEMSQARMGRAILGLQGYSGDTIPWVLADNSVILATADELQEALVLAGAEQSRIWVQQ